MKKSNDQAKFKDFEVRVKRKNDMVYLTEGSE